MNKKSILFKKLKVNIANKLKISQTEKAFYNL